MKKLLLLLTGILIVTVSFSQTWSLSGNTGTNSSHFLGTTDQMPLIFKVENILSGFTGYSQKSNVSFGWNALINGFSQGTGNTAIGVQAMQYNAGSENVGIGHWTMLYNGGNYNVAIGGSNLFANSGASYNTAIGYLSLKNNTIDGNTAVGYESAVENTTGEAITAVGFKALRNNTTGSMNTGLGLNALLKNTTGTGNTAVGSWTLTENATGNFNTTIGMKSLYLNTTGEYNTAIGAQALQENTTGAWNVGLGSGALYSNTTGGLNTAVGTSALWFNTIGEQNVAVGEEALAGNIDGSYNTAIGTRALWSAINDPGAIPFGHASGNNALGFEALKGITTGGSNVGIGVHASQNTTTGNENISMGNYAQSNNTTGSGNIAIGHWALSKNKTGSSNIAIGHFADVKNENLTNATAIGAGTIATTNNQVAIGNNKVTSIRGYVNWTTISDERIKKNVRDNVPGLSFINKLQPVTYNLDIGEADRLLKSVKSRDSGDPEKAPLQLKSEIQDMVFSGFIAQQVKAAAESLGYDFSGVDATDADNSLYGIRYAEFVVPLVKAIQELSIRNEELITTVDELETQVQILSDRISTGDVVNNLSNRISSAILEQNTPNPFTLSTTIRYSLPESMKSAHLVVTDTNGKKIRQIPIYGSGSNSMEIETGSLIAGIYYCSLFVDGSLVATKKLLKSK